MTTITFGGGPTTEARRNFSNLKSGSEVPGYGGYIHQLKYNSGHTYGEQTHILADKFPNIKQKSSFDLSSNSLIRSDYIKQTPLRNELPRATGGNKLTESMIPGYTGYIPSRKFHFSDTYKNECDHCIDDFLSEKREKSKKENEIIHFVNTQPKHKQIADEEDLKQKLSIKNDLNFVKYQNDKREFTEPPIPGYTGYIPRIIPTELGLGSRYHLTTERGLNDFKNNYLRERSLANINKSVQFADQTTQSLDYLDIQQKPSAKRIFVRPGMIPKYTGYVHGRKYEFGSTYGNTTRDLPVCSHNAPSFGDYMDKNPPKTFVC